MRIRNQPNPFHPVCHGLLSPRRRHQRQRRPHISLFIRLYGMLLKGQERILRVSAGTPFVAIGL